MNKITIIILAIVLSASISKAQRYNAKSINEAVIADSIAKASEYESEKRNISFDLCNTEENSFNSVIKYKVYKLNVDILKLNLVAFINKNNFKMFNQTNNYSDYEFEFEVNSDKLNKLDSFLLSQGILISKSVSYNDRGCISNQKRKELNNLTEKRNESQKLLLKTDTNKYKEYINLLKDIIDLNAEIFYLQEEIKGIDNFLVRNKVSVTITNDKFSTRTIKRDFYNMPGVGVSMLSPNQPKTNASFSNYQGINFRYSLLRSNSYLEFNILKNNSKTTDTLAIKDIYMLGYGIKIYSLYLGNGLRNFINPYIGIQSGACIISDKNKNYTTAYCFPEVGVELIKNRYVMIDVKTSFFLPFKNNMNLRGLNTAAYLSFVF